MKDGEEIYVATGKGFADALTGAIVAAQSNGWLMLTGADERTGLTYEQEKLLTEAKDRVKDLYVIGGPAVVLESTVDRIRSLLGREK